MTITDFLADLNDWSNHRPLLWYALEETKTGVVVECGMGGGSTPYLHQYCKDANRNLLSFETDKAWIEQFKHFDTTDHLFEGWQHGISYVEDWGNLMELDPSVILIDNAPGIMRKEVIKQWADFTGIMVIHDTQPPPTAADYKYDEIWGLWKYRVNLTAPRNERARKKDNRTWASAVSNYYDVREWRGRFAGKDEYKIQI